MSASTDTIGDFLTSIRNGSQAQKAVITFQWSRLREGVAKILVTFFKDFAKLEVKGGVLDAKILTKAEVEYLSKLPSLDGIRAQLLSLLSTPASQFVRLLDAKREKDEKAA